jgi:chemotaxis signal transduction protein
MANTRIRKHMAAVDNYRQRLSALQGSWDTLSLLSHLSGNGTDLTQTRHAFEKLSAELLTNLENETLKKTMLALKASAQIAIDIVVRNLYERTADVGFLCADDELREFVTQASATENESELAKLRRPIHGRLREYVAKYSVYQNVIVTDLVGNVLVQLDDSQNVTRSADPLIKFTAGSSIYVETFRKTDLNPGEEQSLVYSARICEGNRPIGVLCLCFKFADEVRSIFAKLRDASDWTLLTFLDTEGRIIASTDPWQLPLGMHLESAFSENGKIIRACGREYFAISRKTQGYQGYMGPGWVGHVLIPVDHAFDHDESVASATGDAAVSPEILASLRASQVIFSPALRAIPQQADNIQRELNRSVWNGNVGLTGQVSNKNDFAKVLLWEIGNTGVKTKDTFERSIGELQQTVVSSILDDTQLLASLAVDILDRNLYERANDCRWWSLSGVLHHELANAKPDSKRITTLLEQINSLYTVYHAIVVFDANKRVLGVSNPALNDMIGNVLTEEWADRTLQLRDTQSYCFSAFEPSPLYRDQDGSNRHTLIYSAAIGGKSNRGGVAVVFDSGPQISAILQDSLPRTETGAIATGCIGVFVDSNRKVIAATDRFQPGEDFDFAKSFAQVTTTSTACIATIEQQHFAVGACKTSGYREYRGQDITAYILIPLGAVAAHKVAPRRAQSNQRRAQTSDQVVDIATFYCDDQWLGLFREHIVESIDGADVQPMPGRPSWHAGCLMYQGDPIPVVDIGRLTGRTTARTACDVIVVRAREGEQRIGILVDALGDIPEVPVHAIVPVADAMFQSNTSVLDRVVRPQNPNDPVLLILSIEQLLLQLRSREPLPPQAVTKAAPATKAPALKVVK